MEGSADELVILEWFTLPAIDNIKIKTTYTSVNQFCSQLFKLFIAIRYRCIAHLGFTDSMAMTVNADIIFILL